MRERYPRPEAKSSLGNFFRERALVFLKRLHQRYCTYKIPGKQTTEDVAWDSAQRLEGLSGDKLEVTANAFQTFLDQMLTLPAVDAVVLLESSVPDCPTTLAIGVLTPITMETCSIQTIDAVKRAKAELNKRLDPVMPSGLMLVNTVNQDVQSLKSFLEKQYSEDPTVLLLSFTVFKRNNAVVRTSLLGKKL